MNCKLKINRSIASILVVVLLIFLDQVAKSLCILYLKDYPSLTLQVTDFFDIVYVWNYGISFGLLKEYYQYSNIVLAVINTMIVSYLVYINFKVQCSQLCALGYDLILGGAIGNLVDRFYRGAVFDFLYFHFYGYGFPVFNLADSFISIGVILVLLDYVIPKRKYK